MVSLTLKVILHVAENDSKYRDVAPLSRHPRAAYKNSEIQSLYGSFNKQDFVKRPGS